MEGGRFVDAGSAFYEKLRVEVGGRKKMLWIPCSMPMGPVAPSDAQLRQLRTLLEAHEAALASQTLFLDAAGLLQTFEPLYQLVRELQGICARRVDLTEALTGGLGLDRLPEGLHRLKEQVLELHVQSTQLKELPEWIGEFGRLETLDLVGGEEDGPQNEEMTELPESIGNLACLNNLHLSGFTQLKVLPETIQRLTGLGSLRLEEWPHAAAVEVGALDIAAQAASCQY
jgi:hypothetical protein